MNTPITAVFAAPLFTSLVYWYSNYTLVVIGAVILCAVSFLPAIDPIYAVFVIYCVGLGLG